MASAAGLLAAKINGVFRVDVKGLRWEVGRVVNQIVTGGGVVESVGAQLVSGSCDEIIPIEGQGPYDWQNLTDFSIQIYDFETRSKLLHQASGCNWDRISGQGDLQSANAGRTISWKGTSVPKV